MVGHAAAGRRRLDDPRRLRRLPEFAATKGIHLAIKSGMLAAETAFDALRKNDFSRRDAAAITKKRVEASWIKDELWPVRNFHQGFEHGSVAGMIHAGLAAGHRRPRPACNRYTAHAGYTAHEAA